MNGSRTSTDEVDARLADVRHLLSELVDLRCDVALAPMTTYKVGGPAALFTQPTSYEDLELVAAAVSRTSVPVLVIGRGSNLLISDRGFAGLVISLAGLGEGIDLDDGFCSASAAVPLPVLARRTASAGWSGLEWMVGVPGSVGGAVRMNAGGHGSDIAACLVDADMIDLRTGEREIRSVERLALRFRGSGIEDHEVVLRARFTVVAGDRDASERELSEIVKWRREHQPGGQNAGSVFVNPLPGRLSAGELIDRVGLRGHRLGTAHVSNKHANFIQADEGGRAQDVWELMQLVQERVATETGFELRSEVRLIGFDHQP